VDNGCGERCHEGNIADSHGRGSRLRWASREAALPGLASRVTWRRKAWTACASPICSRYPYVQKLTHVITSVISLSGTTSFFE
jgi:hypothetical protein